MENPLSFVCFRKKFGKNSLEGRPDVGPHGHKGAVTREKRERSRESSHKFQEDTGNGAGPLRDPDFVPANLQLANNYSI